MSPGSQPLDDLVARALAEDVGDGDVTGRATVPADVRAVATITQKAAGVVFGLDAAEATFRALDPAVELERLGPEGGGASRRRRCCAPPATPARCSPPSARR